MKLQIQHLSPYLPYGLKVRRKSSNREIIIDMYAYNIYDILQHTSIYKPILRPLSDLTKEIEVNGKKFVPIVELAKLFHVKTNIGLLITKMQ